jgi:hypothetical protein
MRKAQCIGVGLAMSMLSIAALAQDEEPSLFTYATYFHCKAGLEEAADAMMERDAPIIDGLVEDGTIAGWGWLSHHTGGSWRRIRYHLSDSAEGALAALATMDDAVVEPRPVRNMTTTCGRSRPDR